MSGSAGKGNGGPGESESNLQPPRPKRGALPLSYTRLTGASDEDRTRHTAVTGRPLH